MTCKLGIIGGGNMGQVILQGALEAGVLEPAEVAVADLDPACREAVSRLGCRAAEDPASVCDCGQLMLAVDRPAE